MFPSQGTGLPAGLTSPGHQCWQDFPAGQGAAWAEGAASAKPPNINSVVAIPAIAALIDLGLFSVSPGLVLGKRGNRDVGFTLAPSLLAAPGRPLWQVNTRRRRYRS